jgi:hypothetical protein
MNLPSLLFALRVLIADTFAQARAAGITWGLLAVTVVCSLLCLSLDIRGDIAPLETRPWEHPELIPRSEAERLRMNPDQVRDEGVDVPQGELRMFFGTIKVPLTRGRTQAVQFVQLILAGGVADTIGILLCILWTASFLPTFLEPATASVLVAKPPARWTLLLGKAVGIVVVVAIQALIFVAATWLAIGGRTGVWDIRYFLAVPILIIHFTVFLSVSAVIAVYTRSTVACAAGTLLFWLLCFGVNLARHEAMLAEPPAVAPLLETAYWILPKPADFNLLLVATVDSNNVAPPTMLDTRRALTSEWALFTGVIFAGVMLAWAGRRFAKTDY